MESFEDSGKGISSDLTSATDTQDESELLGTILEKEPPGEVVTQQIPEPDTKTEKTGRAKRREKRLRNEPQSVTGEGPSGVHVLDFAEARATELSHMLKALKSKGGPKRAFQELPRHMRRRAMSHNVKRLPKRLRNRAEKEKEKSSTDSKKKDKPASRKQRRKTSNLRTEYQRRQREFAWLETHIWHAKRMKMVNKYYGYRLAEHCIDKGVRAAYRSLMHGCMLSDISYYCCTEVTGEQRSIIPCLNPLFSPDTGLTIKAKAYLKGQREGKAVIYKPGAYPYGAIGPVQFLWQAPPPQKPAESASEISATSSGQKTQTKLWIWCHPAMHEQVLFEIQSRVNLYTSGQSLTPITVKNMKLDLIRFRLVGPRSHALLMETLKPVFEYSEDPSLASDASRPPGEETVSCETKWWAGIQDCLSAHSSVLSSHYPAIKSASNPAQFSSGIVLGLTVFDPRLFTPSKRTDMVSMYYPKQRRNGFHLPSLFPHRGDHMNEEESDEDSEGKGDDQTSQEEGEEEVYGEEDMTEISDVGVQLKDENPLPDTPLPQLPTELAYSPIWDQNIRQVVSQSKIKEHCLNGLRSKQLIRSSILELGGGANTIPVLLIQNPMQQNQGCSSGQQHAGTGWDLVLPSNWAMEFWVVLVYRGARACGMKELRKCSLEVQAPNFPEDFPDTLAGKRYNLEQKEMLELKFRNLPPDKRRNFGKFLIAAPFYSLWDDLVSTWSKNAHQFLSPSRRGDRDEDDQPPSKRARLDVEATVRKGTTTHTSISDAKSGPLKQINSSQHTQPSVFYVLRSRDILRSLRLFIEYVFTHKKQQMKMAESSSTHSPSSTFFQISMQEFQVDQYLQEHTSALLMVKFETNQRGTVRDRATISIPTPLDLQSLVKCTHQCPFSGPKEVINPKGLTVVDGKSVVIGITSLSRQQVKEVKQIHILRQRANRGKPGLSSVRVSPSKDFKLCPVIPSRQEFGYATTAGLRLSTSHCAGVGFCTLAGILETIKRCYLAPQIHEVLALARGEDTQYWIIKLQLL